MIDNPPAQQHILIPITLSEIDRPAIRMGLQTAAATQAQVTILHSRPMPVETLTRNWLDSIDRLHHSLSSPGAADIKSLVQAANNQLTAFVDSAGVSSLLARIEVILVSRPGDFCEEVLRFARTRPTDVVILPGELLQGWLPVVPSRLRQKLQQLGKRILAVWPEMTDHAATPTETQAAFA
jgi:hypothetical protein